MSVEGQRPPETDSRPPVTRPNILVVLADQLRRSALGCYGDLNVRTPHIDRLACNGVRFANACVTYPVCVPTRFSFLTGEYAHTRLVPAIGWRMSPAERTIAHELTDAGYQTALFGKWHLHGEFGISAKAGHTRIPRGYRGGFEHWRAFEFRNDPFDTHVFVDDEPSPRKIDGYQTDGLFDLAMEFMGGERDATRPFFAVLSVEPPHSPRVAPPAYMDAWRDRALRLPPNVLSDNEAEVDGFMGRTNEWVAPPDSNERLLAHARAYYAMVENLDDNVGRLLHFLEHSGLSSTTAVLFCADHGDLLGAHGLAADGKQFPYEESVGTPLIASFPAGGVAGGRVLGHPTCTEDWYPTIRGLAGLPQDANKPGVDLTPLMTGAVDRLSRAGVLLEFVAEHRPRLPFYGEGWRGLRTERFKYTVRGGPAGGEPWQLFDLADDPYERINLVDRADYRGRASELHAQLRQILVASDDAFVLKPAFGQDGLNLWPVNTPERADLGWG